MRKYFIGSFAALALFAGGVSVSAATLTEAQIQAIMGLLTSFGAESSIVANVDTSLHGGAPSGGTSGANPGSGSGEMCPAIARICSDGTQPVHAAGCKQICPGDADNEIRPPPGWACPMFPRPLKLGSVGDYVKQLQNFLALDSNNAYSAGATGYFGPLTMQAVQRWQASQGVVSSGSPETTGYGALGPKTRDLLMRRCGGSYPGPFPPNPPPVTSTEMQLEARPTSGKAPLTVDFKTTTNPRTNSGDYVVEFGDGSSAPMESDGMAGICVVGAGGPCNGYNGLVTSHTYKTNGTYTAKLMYDNCPDGAQCFVGPREVSRVTITVGVTANETTTLSATPTSGSSPLTVSFIWKGAAPTMVDFGDGVTQDIVLPTIYPAPTQGSFSHTYASGGSYTATIQSGRCGRGYEGTPRCLMPTKLLDSVTIKVTGSSSDTSNEVLHATPTSGSAPLGVSFWYAGPTISMQAGNAMYEAYAIDFGDGASATPTNGCAPNPGVNGVSTTICRLALTSTHTYTSAGTYTAKLSKTVTPACYYSEPACLMPSTVETLGSVKITVTGSGSQNSLLRATPTSGGAPLRVSFSATGGAGTYYITYGDGAQGTLSGGCGVYRETSSSPTCTTGTYYGSHTYTANGMYTATVSRAATCAAGVACPAYLQNVGTVTIAVDGEVPSPSYIPGQNCTSEYCPQ